MPPKIGASQSAPQLGAIADEVRDAARVARQGQEDDLRDALARMMARVEELCAALKAGAAARGELETQLALAASNLKMATANNDMLEDALRRAKASSDVGWRRAPSQPHPDADEGSPPSTAAPDSRFFGFRFSSGRTTPVPSEKPPGSPPPTASRLTGHLTSASLPSLVPIPAPADTKELDAARAELEAARSDLAAIRAERDGAQAALEAERKARAAAGDEKRALEEELEGLSQALFEEANNMVASERRARAEAEAERDDARAEKDALRAALRLIEDARIRDADAAAAAAQSRSSSRAGVKSPPESPRRSGNDSDEVEAALAPTSPEPPPDPIKPPPRSSSIFLNGVTLPPPASPEPTPEPSPSPGATPDAAPPQVIYAPASSSDSVLASPWAQRRAASSEDVLPRTPFTPPPPDEDSPWR